MSDDLQEGLEFLLERLANEQAAGQRLRHLVQDTRSGLLKELGDAQAQIERLKAQRDHWEHECKIAYKAFDESNVKKFYEEMHQADIAEHNRLMHEIAVLKARQE